MLCSALLLLAVLPSAFTASVPLHDTHDHEHSHVERTQLPGQWYQREAHPVHKLFQRAPGDGVQRPAVGSAGMFNLFMFPHLHADEWAAPYPRGVPDSTQLPQAWVNALNAAVAAGSIPDIPQSTNTPQTNPVYPAGINPVGPEVCSATYKCRNPDDIWDAPDGVFASSFDDGPYPATAQLVDFLTSNNVKTTHFMIGINILNYPQLFLQAFDAGGDIAVHTYNHLYMTTLSNLDILGWTMQIIHESTGGRIPRYWRPPYGDSDNRVRAIAKEVFGMDTVIWNQDTLDWSIASGGTTQDRVHEQMTQWLGGPKSPGLVILEHEISDITVGAFIAAFPLIAQNGWKFESLAEAYGDGPYQNADDSTSDDVVEASIVDGAGGRDLMSSSASSASETPTQTAQAELPATTSSSAPSSSKTNSGISVRLGSSWTAPALLGSLLAVLLL